jgi:proteic killer suppression protein
MEVRFRAGSLETLESDAAFDGGYPQAVVRAFRMRMQLIRSADDERAFYALKSLHFQKLKGDRDHQHSIRLNDQWRLIIELEESKPRKTVWIVDIEDYH